MAGPIVHRRAPGDRPRLSVLERAALAGEIAVSYVRVRLLMRRQDMRDAVAAIRARARPATGDTAQFAAHLGAVVDGYIGRLPGDTRCLARSLVLMTMLARRGLDGTLIIGVRTAPAFGAHAWVELDGRPLLQPIEPTGKRLVEL
jgi:Transglutaminase-like superfamily